MTTNANSLKANSLKIAAALAGALSMAALLPASGASAAESGGLEKCYGISKAGQNPGRIVAPTPPAPIPAPASPPSISMAGSGAR
jgi:uncharacterized membrane protein